MGPFLGEGARAIQLVLGPCRRSGYRRCGSGGSPVHHCANGTPTRTKRCGTTCSAAYASPACQS